VLDLVPAALGVFVVSFADEILTARAFAGRRGESVRASQELFAMGAANAAAGVTQGFSIGASGSRTAVNDAMGARTQFAGLFAAGATLLILLLLTGPMQYLPTAVLGAVIVVAAVGLIEPAAWRALAAIDAVELAIAAVTTACVVLLGVLEALVVAVGLSIIDTVRRSARPNDAVLGWASRLGRYADVALNPDAEVLPGVVLYRLDDRLFFANARYVKGRVHEAIRAARTESAWLVFDAEAVTYVDSTGLQALDELIDELSADGITLVMARVRTAVQRQLDDAALAEKIGAEHFHPTVRAAVRAIVADQRGDARA
jgi:MFS superfamily sulfate permease-like transporter